MSAPLVVNTKDGVCWTRRAVTSGGIALYAPESVKTCPNFVMATLAELAELAEHGIAGSADALPVPFGPQMSDFPPPPRTELEKLHSERARLQGLLAEATTDAHRARRERDLIRERVSEPFGCAHCGVEKRSHGRRYISGAGMHAWERPSDEQVKDRMLARRVARMALPSNLNLWEEGAATAELRAQVTELEARLAEYERPADEDPIALELTDKAEVFVPRTERERWVNIADALNAAHAAGMPVGIDLDGTLTDHRMWSVVWDRDAERWTVAGYEDDAEQAVSVELPPATVRCGCGHPGSEHHHVGAKCWARLPRELGQPVRICPCAAFAPVSVDESADRLARYMAPTEGAE
ncbi:hypothetical protein ABTZ58_03905 [Streptomyces sp. NPDC094143]|uniref:hypothetical protein n=1 Tax=unclassified Streptomyces TaxID=2593676 RepID=UPI003330EA9F